MITPNVATVKHPTRTIIPSGINAIIFLLSFLRHISIPIMISAIIIGMAVIAVVIDVTFRMAEVEGALLSSKQNASWLVFTTRLGLRSPYTRNTTNKVMYITQGKATSVAVVIRSTLFVLKTGLWRMMAMT
jgi:hypothetical protein